MSVAPLSVLERGLAALAPGHRLLGPYWRFCGGGGAYSVVCARGAKTWTLKRRGGVQG